MVSESTIHIILYTVGAVVIGTWLCAWYYVHSRQEPVSLDMQAWVGDTRKEGETAIYRNVTAPPSGNLINGLELRVKNKSYKFRKGNFGDVWQCALDLSKDSKAFIEFQNHDEKATMMSLQEMDVLTMKFYNFFKNYNTKDKLRIGVSCSVYKYAGFVQTIGFLITCLKLENYELELLDSIPRSKTNVDILFVDDFETVSKMNNSEDWYKLIIVAESLDSVDGKRDVSANVISWDKIVADNAPQKGESNFKYDAGEDYQKDDDKVLFYYKNTSFNQLNLVSSIAALITSFPANHTLSGKDVLQVLVHEDGSASTREKDFQNTQMLYKVFGVLMHGGSVILSTSDRFKIIPRATILSLCGEPFRKQLSKLGTSISFVQKLKLIWAMNFISENIFVGFGCVLGKNFKLRLIFMENNIKDYTKCVEYGVKSIQPYEFAKRRTIMTEQLGEYRSLFGARVILETFVPLNIMGPVFLSHFYDYRVLPRAVDRKYQFCGVIAPCLETKLIESDNLDISKRQGMVCVRGFNIGKPTGSSYDEALKLSETFDKNREGWMPLLGVYGVFGVDQCFYEM